MTEPRLTMAAPNTPLGEMTGISMFDNHNAHEPSQMHVLLVKPEELDAQPAGTRVVDATSDLWVKLPSGLWEFNGERITSAMLAGAWGPLRLLEGGL